MKLKKILAAAIATAVAVSTMAISSFALVEKVDPIVLNSGSDTDKLVQWSLGCFDVGDIDTITIYATVPAGEDGWIGGGGGFGYDSVAGWIQVDFDLDKEFVTVDEAGNIVATLDFSALAEDGSVDLSKADGLAQLGWWWGSGDGTLSVTDIQVNGTSVLGKTAAAAPAEEEAVEEEAAAEEVAEEAPAEVAEEAPAEVVEEAPAADTATEAAATGNTAAAAIVSVMALAGVAAIAAKKRK